LADSSSGLVLAAPDAYGLPVDPSTTQIRNIVFAWLTDDPDAKLVLPTGCSSLVGPA